MTREEAAALKSNMHACFDSPQGKEVMSFLERSCCWYRSVWVPGEPDMTLINDGKRQVLATIKSILDLNPDQIAELSRRAEE
jgi:hypothetical protein